MGQSLAGELKSPGTFSLRTLDFVRSLSQDDANDIALLAQYVCEGVVFYRQVDWKAGEPDLRFFMQMQDLGLLNGVGGGISRAWNFKDITEKKIFLRGHQKVLVITPPHPDAEFEIQVCSLSALGREVMAIGSFQDNEQYLRRIGIAIQQRGCQASLAGYRLTGPNAIEYLDVEKL
jgi:hypothetical protein